MRDINTEEQCKINHILQVKNYYEILKVLLVYPVMKIPSSKTRNLLKANTEMVERFGSFFVSVNILRVIRLFSVHLSPVCSYAGWCILDKLCKIFQTQKLVKIALL